MGILTAASQISVERGYEYYKNKCVTNIERIDDNKYSGKVKGSSIYSVVIDNIHPKKSTCTCPFANGNRICKHMVSLYFSVYETEVDDYEAWMNSKYANSNEDYYDEDYEEDYYDDEYYDYYDEEDEEEHYFYGNEKFEKPLFYNNIFEEFINNLSYDEMKKILEHELSKDEEYTYEKYLKDNYNKYLKKQGNNTIYINNLSKKIRIFTTIYYSEYNYKKFDDEILTKKEIKQLEELYKDNMYRNTLDKFLIIPELFVYENYDFFVKILLENKSEEELSQVISILEDFFNYLKHYGIKNEIPKSNLLINLYYLKKDKLTIKDLAKSLLVNSKYIKYIEFIINTVKETDELFDNFIKIIEKEYYKYKDYIPNVLVHFMNDNTISDDKYLFYYAVYNFICEGDTHFLNYIEEKYEQKYIIDYISNKCTKEKLLMLYAHYNLIDKLYETIEKNNNRVDTYIKYIDKLKDKYSKELYIKLKEEFYTVLEKERTRDNYIKAVYYLKGIFKLNNGKEYINTIVNELKNSEYKKCRALFEEIDKAIKYK